MNSKANLPQRRNELKSELASKAKSPHTRTCLKSDPTPKVDSPQKSTHLKEGVRLPGEESAWAERREWLRLVLVVWRVLAAGEHPDAAVSASTHPHVKVYSPCVFSTFSR